MSEEVKTLTISVKVPIGDPIKLKVKKVTSQIYPKQVLLQFMSWCSGLCFISYSAGYKDGEDIRGYSESVGCRKS